MTLTEKLRGLWLNLIGLPKMIRTLFGPPPFDGYAVPEVPAVDLRDPKTSPIDGDVFKGVHGGLRRFRSFDTETDEAVFTRGDRPSPCREPRAKWLAWVAKATLVSKTESR